jgi:hypothetical protein
VELSIGSRPGLLALGDLGVAADRGLARDEAREAFEERAEQQDDGDE